MILLIARHGQTLWNTQHRMQGQKDSPLTETGRELARRLALRLEGIPIRGILTSPLKRAMDTAELIGKRNGWAVRTDDRLQELDLGRWEGEDMRTIERRYPINFEYFWQNPNRYIELRGGEAYDSLLARTKSFLNDMRAAQGVYLAITHAIALRSIRQNVLGIPTESSRLSMASCCLCQVELTQEKSVIALFGDSYHHDASICRWWHGTPERLTTLRAGSVITRIRPLAEAYAHAPANLSLAADNTVTHDGRRAGWLYRIADAVRPDEVMPAPASAMPLSYEFISKRELRLELVKAVEPNEPLYAPASAAGLTLKL